MKLWGRREFADKKMVLLGAGVVLLLAAGVWAVLARHADDARPSDVLMVMTQRGGLCQGGKACEASYRVLNNGTFERHQKFSGKEISELKEVIGRTDFTKYGRNAEPACPSFADGVDLIFSFPGKHPGKQFTPCMLDVPKDDTGLRRIVEILDAHEGRQ